MGEDRRNDQRFPANFHWNERRRYLPCRLWYRSSPWQTLEKPPRLLDLPGSTTSVGPASHPQEDHPHRPAHSPRSGPQIQRAATERHRHHPPFPRPRSGPTAGSGATPRTKSLQSVAAPKRLHPVQARLRRPVQRMVPDGSGDVCSDGREGNSPLLPNPANPSQQAFQLLQQQLDLVP